MKSTYYLITGFYYNSNRRFRQTSSNMMYALSINLWKGRVWEVLDGKRRLIREVC